MSGIIDLTSSPIQSSRPLPHADDGPSRACRLGSEVELDSDLPTVATGVVAHSRPDRDVAASDPFDWLFSGPGDVPMSGRDARARAADDDCFNLDDFEPAPKRRRRGETDASANSGRMRERDLSPIDLSPSKDRNVRLTGRKDLSPTKKKVSSRSRKRLSFDDPILCTSPPAPATDDHRTDSSHHMADLIATSSQPDADVTAAQSRVRRVPVEFGSDEITELRPQPRPTSRNGCVRHGIPAQSVGRAFLLTMSATRMEQIQPAPVGSLFESSRPFANSRVSVDRVPFAHNRLFVNNRPSADSTPFPINIPFAGDTRHRSATLDYTPRPSRAPPRTARTDKKISTREMLTLLPADLDDAIAAAAAQHLQAVRAEHRAWQSPVGGVVRWKRRMACVWNSQTRDWDTAPLRVVNEKVALVVLTMDEVLAQLEAAGGKGLEPHVALIKSHFKDYEVVYLVQGLGEWQRRMRVERNRQFRQAATATGTGGGAAVALTAHTSASSDVDAKMEAVEDALLEAQVMHGVLMHHTATAAETGQWVAVFTQHLSTAPYRRARDAVHGATATFCMDAGQVATWEEPAAAYEHMFAQVSRLPRLTGALVAARTHNAARLVQLCEREGTEALSREAGGEEDGSRLGVVASKRLWKLFMERDEEAMV